VAVVGAAACRANESERGAEGEAPPLAARSLYGDHRRSGTATAGRERHEREYHDGQRGHRTANGGPRAERVCTGRRHAPQPRQRAAADNVATVLHGRSGPVRSTTSIISIVQCAPGPGRVGT